MDEQPYRPAHGWSWAADQLAAQLLAGPRTQAAISKGLRGRFLPLPGQIRTALAAEAAALGPGGRPPSHPVLVAHLRALNGFWPRAAEASAVLDPLRFAPALETPGALADWAGLTPAHLDWMADERRGHGRAARPLLQHYHYSTVGKSGGRTRLLEAPKPRLKALQRRILHEILHLAPVHPCAHGFTAGRSCLTGAQVHAGERMVLTLDLQEFFPSIGLLRVHGLFRRLGYPWAVARRLAGLCTIITPGTVLLRHPGLLDPRTSTELYRTPHLPQGAPTSPALANLLAWALDRRLHGLARAARANHTRYADDLAFSGDLGGAERMERLRGAIAAIVRQEGFALNPAKTRAMPRSARQQAAGTGAWGRPARLPAPHQPERRGPAGIGSLAPS